MDDVALYYCNTNWPSSTGGLRLSIGWIPRHPSDGSQVQMTLPVEFALHILMRRLDKGSWAGTDFNLRSYRHSPSSTPNGTALERRMGLTIDVTQARDRGIFYRYFTTGDAQQFDRFFTLLQNCSRCGGPSMPRFLRFR
jgi:hypothetical protein